MSILLAAEVCAAVNIAVVAPKYGKQETMGKELISGVRIAVEEINNNGGLNGEKINLIEIEDECNDSLAVSMAQMMALNTNEEYKLSAVIGPYCQNKFDKVSDILAKAEILQIIPTAITGKQSYNQHDGLIKMVGYKEQQANDFFQFYEQNYNNMNVVVIFDNNNKEVAQSVQTVFNDKNQSDKLLLIDFEQYNFDYDKIMQEVLNHSAQISFILGDSIHIVKMAKEIKSQAQNMIVFVNKYQIDEDFEEFASDESDKYFFIALPTLKDNPEFTETLVKLRLLGIEPEGLAVYGYSAVSLWADLVKKSLSFEYKKLADILKNNTFDSGWGKIMFAKGNPVNTINYSIYTLKNGEYTQVY